MTRGPKIVTALDPATLRWVAEHQDVEAERCERIADQMEHWRLEEVGKIEPDVEAAGRAAASRDAWSLDGHKHRDRAKWARACASRIERYRRERVRK